MKSPVTFLLVGAGRRGKLYANYIKKDPLLTQLVAIADPNQATCQKLALEHKIPSINIWQDWRQVASLPRLADAVIISLQDHFHAEATLAFAQKGYHILLEKPMALTPEQNEQIFQQVSQLGCLFSICYPMRYTKYTTLLHRLIHQEKIIGDLVTIDHIEPVGLWRQVQNFVRGDWQSEKTSTFMLMSKSCHDIDWLSYLVQQPCLQVASFGSLQHFRPENAPQNATQTCVTCPVEPSCLYSAKRFYLGHTPYRQRLISDLTPNDTPEAIIQALRTSPWGKCVYHCQNDVVDHQVVTLSFAKKITVTFTMTGFTPQIDRCTHICGTQGYIHCDSHKITHYDFLSDRTTIYDSEKEIPGPSDLHQGGDIRLFECFTLAILHNAPSLIISNLETSFASSMLVFKAEQARKEDKVISCQ